MMKFIHNIKEKDYSFICIKCKKPTTIGNLRGLKGRYLCPMCYIEKYPYGIEEEDND